MFDDCDDIGGDDEGIDKQELERKSNKHSDRKESPGKQRKQWTTIGMNERNKLNVQSTIMMETEESQIDQSLFDPPKEKEESLYNASRGKPEENQSLFDPPKDSIC